MVNICIDSSRDFVSGTYYGLSNGLSVLVVALDDVTNLVQDK